MAVCLVFVFVGTHGCFGAWFPYQALLGYICDMSGVGHGWRAVSPVASLVAPHTSHHHHTREHHTREHHTREHHHMRAPHTSLPHHLHHRHHGAPYRPVQRMTMHVPHHIVWCNINTAAASQVWLAALCHRSDPSSSHQAGP